MVQRASAFLDAWTTKRWGLVAAFTPPVLLGSRSDGAAARYAQDTFGQYDLTSWELRKVIRTGPVPQTFMARHSERRADQTAVPDDL